MLPSTQTSVRGTNGRASSYPAALATGRNSLGEERTHSSHQLDTRWGAAIEMNSHPSGFGRVGLAKSRPMISFANCFAPQRRSSEP